MKQSIKKQSWLQTKLINLIGSRKSITEWYKSTILDIISQWKHLQYVLKNFTQSTIELGTYHLKNGNVNDAIMRFKMVDKFCEPGNELANYWLGIAYYIKNNLTASVYHLGRTNTKNAKEFLHVIQSKDRLNSIPESILATYRDLTSVKRYSSWNKIKYNISTTLVHELFNTLGELPENCKFLDIGSGFGEIGYAINDKIERNYHITGVEDAPTMLEALKHQTPNKQPIYDTVIQKSIRDFLSDTDEQGYNAVISCDSLNFNKNLLNPLHSIHKLIRQDGYLALALKSSNQTYFESSENVFIYAKDDIVKQLNLAEFEVLSIKDLNLSKDGIYTILISTLKKI